MTVKETEELAKELLERNRNGETWMQMEEKYGVTRAALWRIANENYEPKNSEMRRKLGLRELVQVPVKRDPQGRFSK